MTDNGFVKSVLFAPAVRVADCRYNADRTIECLDRAEALGAGLAVFPELGVTGYTAADLLMQPLLQRAALRETLRIARATAGRDMLVLVGLPFSNGGCLYNVAAVLFDGAVIGIVPKVHLPNYGEFNEKRWFAPAPAENTAVCIEGREVPFGSRLLFRSRLQPDFTLAAEICEDIWVSRSPAGDHAAAGANILVNLSASNDVVAKADYRLQMVNVMSSKTTSAYLYCSCGSGESTGDCVFGGHRIVCELGKQLAASELFCGEALVADIDVERIASERRKMISSASPYPPKQSYTAVWFDGAPKNAPLTREFEPLPFVPADIAERERRAALVFAMQVEGLSSRMAHIGAKKAVIGVSGGLDSTLALLVTAAVFDKLGLDRKGIIAVTMPCFGTTRRTRGNAEKLSRKLGADFRTIDISRSVTQHLNDLGVAEADHGVHYENAQARERTQVLMDIANAEGGLVIGTGDLSESALGWCTYGGDHMSMYNVNCTVPKTLIAHIIRHAAARFGGIEAETEDVIKTPISPELLGSGDGIVQLTEDIIGPYILHDFFLYYTVRWLYAPRRLMLIAERAFAGLYSRAELLKWLRVFYTRFFRNQFKRSCMPDGPKTGSVSLSPRSDWRMPSDASAVLWLGELDAMEKE